MWVHLVWAVKNRQNLITERLKPVLYDKFIDIGEENGYLIREVNGVEDHIHFLIMLDPIHKISDIVKNLKGATSHWINEQTLTDTVFEWQSGYGAFTVSSFMVEKVRSYIQNQEQHHLDKDFDKEMKYLEVLGNDLN